MPTDETIVKAHLMLALDIGEIYEKALREISNMDYRGNRSTEQTIAYGALKDAKTLFQLKGGYDRATTGQDEEDRV